MPNSLKKNSLTDAEVRTSDVGESSLPESLPQLEIQPVRLTEAEKENLYVNNTDLIHYVCHSFSNMKMEYEEIYSTCVLGFTKALNAFDKNKGVKFSTFAVNCMRNEVLFFFRREKKHMLNNTSIGAILSVDKDGRNFELGDILSADKYDKQASIEALYEVTDDKKMILEAIDTLTEMEQYIMFERYGLRGQDTKTQKRIAEEIHMSQANVSKIQKTCLDKIQRYIMRRYKDDRINLKD